MGNELLNTRWLKHVRGVIQIGMGSPGAALTEDRIWKGANIKHRIYIEAHKPYFDALKQVLTDAGDTSVNLYHLAISDVDGIAPFYVTNISNSMSLYPVVPMNQEKMTDGERIYVPTKRLDTFIYEEHFDIRNYNLLYIDVQGAEGDIIKGAIRNISYFDFVGMELFEERLYQNHMLYNEVVDEMDRLGFYMMSRQPLPWRSKSGMLAWDVSFIRKDWAIQHAGPGYPGGYEENW